MLKQINFTLKFAYNFEKEDDKKARIVIDFTPEFSPELNRRTEIPPFNPKRLREALHFVEVGVIQRIVEHLMKEKLTKSHSDTWNYRKAALTEMNPVLEKIDKLKGSKTPGASSKEKEEIAKLEDSIKKPSQEFDKHDQLIRLEVEKMITSWEKMIEDWEKQPHLEEKPELRLTRIGFEQMSAALPTYSVQRVANTDVPPPKPKL